jgi:hypothetical protein
MSDPRYEVSDANTRGVWFSAVGIAVLLALAFFGIAALFGWFSAHPQSTVQASRTTGQGTTPPGPNLQAAPREDLDAYQQREHHLLDSYGWTDPAKTTLHIPIARAMELLAQRGIPLGHPMTPLEMQQQKAKEHTP